MYGSDEVLPHGLPGCIVEARLDERRVNAKRLQLSLQCFRDAFDGELMDGMPFPFMEKSDKSARQPITPQSAMKSHSPS